MTQTWAIFLGAYRNLNSKKLFWLVLILSGLVAAAFACIGINETGLKLAFWQIDNDVINLKQMPPDQFYKTMFAQVGIGIWLSWLATILAIISTAGIFPDLMTSGSIDLFVSKPIGRLRLFVTEYAAGLLFVTLQVTIFSAACFLVIGLRGGAWEPALFLAVPIMVCFFSYLFSISAFLGVVTRSTVAALLLTLLFWFFVWAVGTAENTLLIFKTMQERGVDFAAVQAESNGNKPNAPDKKEKQAESSAVEKPNAPDKKGPAGGIAGGRETATGRGRTTKRLPGARHRTPHHVRSQNGAAEDKRNHYAFRPIIDQTGQTSPAATRPRDRTHAGRPNGGRPNSLRPLHRLGHGHVAGIRGLCLVLGGIVLLPPRLLNAHAGRRLFYKDTSPKRKRGQV